jgi:hypothetical protein
VREEAEVRRSKIIAMLFSAFLCSDLLRFCAGDCFESFLVVEKRSKGGREGW